ncbi:MAG TPA: polymorphic toxin-type HINT domain-containing protein [Pirellulaceae bacterium]|nr:polymorphic toxin-type HINT domain-containing protein [Pirellulaceae bacterium]
MSWRSFSVATRSVVFLIASIGVVRSEAAAADHDTAAQLVAEALHREVYGLQSDRNRLLAEAATLDPNYAPARWHRGFVRVGAGWSHVDDAPGIIGTSSALATYRKMREERADTLEDHLQLAEWCGERRMPDQQRAHLSRVLEFDPNHADAREQLGFRLSNGQWIHATELRRRTEQQASRQEALEDWRPKMLDLRRGLSQPHPDKRTRAEASIRAITAADAVPAFEEILSPHSQVAAKLVLESLAKMPEQDAVDSLVRHAVFSPWPEVRDEASLLLANRPHERFVPSLLAEMYTPVESQTSMAPANGRLVYQHAFAREGQEQRQVLVLNSVYRRRAIPGGDGSQTLFRALADSFAMAARLQQSAQQQNAATRLLNERIARVLNLATQQNLPANPQSWWQWWNEQNDVVLQGQKQTQQQQLTRQVVMLDQSPSQLFSDGFQSGFSPRQQRGECFAAGTAVWTGSGMMPIETVRVGDVVLSQDIETGELAYKPVLRTTIRPMEHLIKIQVGNETFETSGGHLFWVSGQGWSKARELESGHSLHAIEGAVPVTAVESGTEAQTYNLVVADFSTYVVGASKLLSHDVTDRRPTRTIVPGFMAH